MKIISSVILIYSFHKHFFFFFFTSGIGVNGAFKNELDLYHVFKEFIGYWGNSALQIAIIQGIK